MRWVIRSVFALLLLVILAVGAVFLIPAEKIAGIAVSKFNSLTGRVLTIDGSVKPSFWPQLGVTTGPVTISNAEWSKAGPMVEAKGLSIAVDMAALIGGTVKITGIEATSPVVRLERSAKGQENWIFGGDAGGTVTAATPGVGAGFTLDKAVITGGSFSFVDQAAGSRFGVDDVSGTVKIPSYTGRADVDLTGTVKGQPFGAVVVIGGFQDFLDGKVGPLDLNLTAGKAKVDFKGRAGWNPMAAEGDLVADLADLRAVMALAGRAPPAMPQGLGAKSVLVAGAVTLTPEMSLHLRGGKVALDGNDLAVEADFLTAGARPKLSAKVTAGALDLAALAGGEGGGSSGGAAASGWPKDKIDVSALSAMDAAVALSAQSVDLGLVKFGVTQAVITNERSRAVVDLRKVAAYDGVISGNFVMNGRGSLSVGGDLSFAGMNLQPLLRDFGGYERLLGTGDLRVKFLGSGNSINAIMQGLEGSGTLALSNGEIRGLDIAGMLRTLDTSYVGEGQKTIFEALGGTFVINGGVLSNEDLVLKSPYITAKGVGEVGLGARDLNYRIKATALTDDQGAGGINVPLVITGPWAKPKYALDLQALADEHLAEEKAKLEAAAKAKAAKLEADAKAKLKDQLGIVQQEGESLEDAAKRRAQEALDEEARKALEKLLGGGN